jgi:hypothetical protein
MNTIYKAAWLSASLALMSAMTAPAFADEWNKETKFEFSAPVEVPGKVLTPGKYVFKLADSESDRNVVEIFSEDASGTQNLVTTILTIPDYRENTPDKPIIQFEERASGSPEAIHSWFYPGENTGWEFLYSKGERLTSSSTTPAAAPAPAATPAPAPAAAAAPAPTPKLAAAREPVATVTTSEDDVAIIAQNDQPELLPAPSRDNQEFADRTLPQTAGNSGMALMSGISMFIGGVAAVFASRQKA